MSRRAKAITAIVIGAWTAAFLWLQLFYKFSDVGEPDDPGAVLAGYIERGFFGVIWLIGLVAALVYVRVYIGGQRPHTN